MSANQAIDIDTQSGKGTALLRIEYGASQYDHSQHDCDTCPRPAALVVGLA